MSLRIKKIPLEPNICGAILFVLCILTSNIQRNMNYANFGVMAVFAYQIYSSRKVRKNYLGFIWGIYIIIYPLLDAKFRGEVGLSTFDFFCYASPLFAMIGNDFHDKELMILCRGIKYLARFQAFGMILSRVWRRLYIIIAWRVLGNWTPTVMGFSPNQAVVACALSGGYCVVLSEYLFSDRIYYINRVDKLKMLLEIGIYIYTLVQTTKRFVLIAIVAATFVLLICKSINNGKKLIITIAVFAIFIIGAYYICIGCYQIYGETNAIGRLGATILGLEQGEDVSNNRSLWASFMTEWWQENKLFGIGWESFKKRILYKGYGNVPNAHNVYKQVLCETGYVGEVVFVGILSFTFINHIRNLIINVVENRDCYGFCVYSGVAVSLFVIFAVYCGSGNAIYDSFAYLYLFSSVILGDGINVYYSNKCRINRYNQEMEEVLLKV